MRKFHSIAALCGDGLRPELQAPFERLAVDPRTELFVRDDGMVQAGPDPASETEATNVAPLNKRTAADLIWRPAQFSCPTNPARWHCYSLPFDEGCG